MAPLFMFTLCLTNCTFLATNHKSNQFRKPFSNLQSNSPKTSYYNNNVWTSFRMQWQSIWAQTHKHTQLKRNDLDEHVLWYTHKQLWARIVCVCVCAHMVSLCYMLSLRKYAAISLHTGSLQRRRRCRRRTCTANARQRSAYRPKCMRFQRLDNIAESKMQGKYRMFEAFARCVRNHTMRMYNIVCE